MHRKPEIKTILGKTFYLAHGDGLGAGDKGYKFIKWVFERKINQWLFRWLHPDIGLALGLYFSRKSRYANQLKESQLEQAPTDDYIRASRMPKHAQSLLDKGDEIDYFVMGHWHIARQIELSGKSRFIFLGDWITQFSYGVFDGESFELLKFQ